ncbi:MAG: hypothetical protein EP330_16635 [Deltaproteobacteria bacterium]|nr:MAG: hypothetical protein EP330_16635 [Deltaproteobacteria bacterium]
MKPKWFGVLAFGLVMGCATAIDGLSAPEDVDLRDPAQVVSWANTVSPLSIAYYAIEPLSESQFLTSDCPLTTEVDGELHVDGWCTTADGTGWHGTAVIEGYDPETGDGAYHFVDFGSEVRLTGTARFETVDGVQNYWVDMLREDRGERVGIVYQGARWEEDGVQVRDGAGSVAVEGEGTVHAQTIGQRRDEARCQYESLAGQTRMLADGREVVVTYDGEVDCDPEHTAHWRLDGVEMGEIGGVSCATMGPGAGLWALLPLLVVRRRR